MKTQHSIVDDSREPLHPAGSADGGANQSMRSATARDALTALGRLLARQAAAEAMRACHCPGDLRDGTIHMTTGSPDRRRFRSVNDIAEKLDVSTKTVRRWIESGELHVDRFGRRVRISSVMEEHEDISQLVIGMAGNSLFNELFSGGQGLSNERLGAWFDQATATLGGRDVVETVRELLGNVSRFDFQQVGTRA